MPAAVAAALPPLTRHLRCSVAVLPASLEADDPVAMAVAGNLPPAAEPTILTPVSGAAARRAFLLPSVIGGWKEEPVRAAGSSTASVLLPEPLVDAAYRLVAVDVVEVARRGPFVLDLLARYIHPRQRLRLVSDRQRSNIVAEVASVALPAFAIVSLGVPGGALVAVTNDVIAAELVALALAERCIGASRAFTGPWEDDVVQRATELQLGVLLPSGITLQTAGGAVNEPWAVSLLDHLTHRLGLPAR